MTVRRVRTIGVAAAAVAVVAAAVGAVAAVASCQATPPNNPLHTLQQSQRMDVVCMLVNDPNGNALPAPTPVAQSLCAPVPTNANASTLPYHLYAVVTQATIGQIGVIDLTAGNVIDVNRENPGIDSIPVGANPTDIAVTPDAQQTFVSSADPNKMAIYVIDNKRLLGDSTGTSPPQPLKLTDVKACSLPQPPQRIAVVPASTPGDAGVLSDGGVAPSDEAGAAADGGAGSPTVLEVTLRANAGSPAVIATIDTSQAAPGSLAPCRILGATALSSSLPPSWTPGPVWPDGVPYADAGPTPVPQCESPTPAIGADAGATLPVAAGTSTLPGEGPHPAGTAMRSDVPILYVADQNVPVIHVIDLRDPTNPLEMPPLLATSVADPMRMIRVGDIAVSPATRDYKTYLYAVDSGQGTVMVYDITDPASTSRTPLQRPHPELNPLATPDRLVFAGPVVDVAFVQHDWPLPSQAPNQQPPFNQYSGLLCNPNPQAHPTADVFLDKGAFYRADEVQLIQSMDNQGGTVQTLPNRLRGIFGFVTLSNGNVVAVDVDDWDAPCRRPDPMAVDAGAQTGVLAIPQPPPTGPDDLNPYHAPETYQTSLPEQAAVTLEAFFPVSAPHRPRANNLLRVDPSLGVHIPNLQGVPQLTNASGAPVSLAGAGGTAPLLLPTQLPPGFRDPSYLVNPVEPNPATMAVSSPAGVGVASDGGAFTAAVDAGADASLEASAVANGEAGTATGPLPALFPGTSSTIAPSVRISFDDPSAHVDQDWSVTYEGTLPTVSGIVADIGSPDGSFQTLRFSAPGASFCGRGVEDWSIGQSRASALVNALSDPAVGLPTPPGFTVDLPSGVPQPTVNQWTADYVEITDDLLQANDPYWTQSNDCWEGDALTGSGNTVAQNRFNFCSDTFGGTSDFGNETPAGASDADLHLARDFPILHANDDFLEVGRFAWYPTDASGNPVAQQTTNRVIVGPDPGNAPFLKLARCCFHHQAAFKVRSGGEWLTVGTVAGLLHQVVKAPAAAGTSPACVLSCDPKKALLNSRSFDVPWAQPPTCTTPPGRIPPQFDRDSPLAFRNPMFSFVVWSACSGTTRVTSSDAGVAVAGFGDHTLASRDLAWKFSIRGSVPPLSVSIVTPTNGTAASPQSMRFIPSIGQLAIVDGEAQGLVLIDLNLVAVVHSFF